MLSSPDIFTTCPPVDLIEFPWTSYSELEHVYRLIYEEEDNVANLTEAKDRLTAWSLVIGRRTAFRPEVSVLTAFVTAALHAKSSDADELVLQSLYSTAIIRLCELMRNYEFNVTKNAIVRVTFIKTGSNRSDLAESLGLPAWIVDLRHEAAHGQRLSLDLARRATFVAMDWLSGHFWPLVLQDKRIDVRIDGIVEQILSGDSGETSVSTAREELFRLLRHSSHASVNFLVRALLRATVRADMTLHQVDPKATVIVKAVVNSGQMHVFLHYLIDRFNDDDRDTRAAAILWFTEVLRGMTTKTSFLSPQLSRFSVSEGRSLPDLDIHLLKVLKHLLQHPSDATLSLVPCFKKLLPDKSDMIDRLWKAMATLVGVQLDSQSVDADFMIKTVKDVESMKLMEVRVTNGPSAPLERGRKRKRADDHT